MRANSALRQVVVLLYQPRCTLEWRSSLLLELSAVAALNIALPLLSDLLFSILVGGGSGSGALEHGHRLLFRNQVRCRNIGHVVSGDCARSHQSLLVDSRCSVWLVSLSDLLRSLSLLNSWCTLWLLEL